MGSDLLWIGLIVAFAIVAGGIQVDGLSDEFDAELDEVTEDDHE